MSLQSCGVFSLFACRLWYSLVQQCLVLLFYLCRCKVWLGWILDFLAIGQMRSHQGPGISQSAYWESETSFDFYFFFIKTVNSISLYLYWHILVPITLILKRWCQKQLFKKPGSWPWLSLGPGAGIGSAILRCDLWFFSAGLGFVPLLLGLLTG